MIKAYSNTQANIALSSAEAEYYSMVKAASEGLGLKAMTEDYKQPLSPRMFVATAAIGVFQGIGLGKLRHLETQSLWLQEAVRDKRIGLSKVHGPVNRADLMTKHVDHATQIRRLGLMSIEARAGRDETARRLEFAQSRSAQWTLAPVTTTATSTIASTARRSSWTGFTSA